MRRSRDVGLGLLTLAALTGCMSPSEKAGTSVVADAKVIETAYPERPYWGDTHLHMSNSIDAFGFGVRLNPEAALRFAKGEEVIASSRLKTKLDRPLDFLVIADHSDGLGATPRLHDAPRALITALTLRK